MGKALIIPNVDFSEVAIDTVTIRQDVYCTGITLDKSTAVINSLSDTLTLIPTVTPSNTADAVIWSVDDSAVARVEGGVVTPLAGGSVTVTATCGSYSASCSISIHAFIDAEIAYGYYFSGAAPSTGDSTVRVGGGASATTYGGSVSETDKTGNGRYAYDSGGHISGGHAYPLAIPDGATGVSVVVPDQTIKFAIAWMDTTNGSGYGNSYAKLVQIEGNPWSTAAGSRVVERPDSGEDSFFISVYLKNNLTQEILDQITVEALFE